jgi:hypothetical protein
MVGVPLAVPWVGRVGTLDDTPNLTLIGYSAVEWGKPLSNYKLSIFAEQFAIDADLAPCS